jgi:hypothetical protein
MASLGANLVLALAMAAAIVIAASDFSARSIATDLMSPTGSGEMIGRH